MDIRSLMDVMGWKQAAMAARYVHSNENTKRAAMAALEKTIVQSAKGKILRFKDKPLREHVHECALPRSTTQRLRLDVRQSSISDAKRRRNIPADWLVTLFAKKRISPEWILCGEGGKYLMSTDAVQDRLHMVRVLEVRPPQSCSAQELFSELVRRALHEPNIEAIRQDVANTWEKKEKARPRRRTRRNP